MFFHAGTQIAPFLPIHGPQSWFQSTYGFFIFLFRLPFFISVVAPYLLIVNWLPVGSFIRKVWLWCILGVSGVWWVDLQVEGVKRGSLARQATRFPGPGNIILSSYTSPLDAIYLSAIFDPIFTASYPSTRLVERVSLPAFLFRYFSTPTLRPSSTANLISLSDLLSQNPTRTILVFPEATPTNGRGILRFTPALASAPRKVKIFPISLKYTPADITTPVPGAYQKFVWSLLSRPTHCIRVRIGDTIYNDAGGERRRSRSSEEEERERESSDTVADADEDEDLDGVCERGSEALARIGRSKRLNLGVKEKIEFIAAWRRRNRLMA
ncbi:hypothetical protein BZA05DRAFT_446168 [Tricharina praecox]|uniref:uncharacterized protein n=1 Tax=Tricharina praecox TaxID=43433 RepID=UPI002220FB07|nr:uncharacterized protein BZA05DRAFT_446168 [Tricharina praecox]KAI5849095.1 hypothetical protein BZA05DRAFT_446168 [Tricharina praecox]